ncbi:MAG: polyketide synthase dehydratase domain-containing protein, partial [Bradymonadaceae bacterium]
LRREEPGSTSPAARGRQMVFAGNVTDESSDHVVLERVFDPERDRFLNDHVYEGNPVLPGVMGYEMMAEAARRLTGDLPAAMADVEFDRAVKLHRGEPLRVIATVERTDDGDIDLTLESQRTVKTGRTVRNEHFAGTARMDDASRSDAETFALDNTDEFDTGPDKPEIYKRFFHDGTFQVMESVPHIGDEVVIGYGRKPTANLVADDAPGQFVTDPMVREMAFQTTGLWGMIQDQLIYLPFGIGQSVQFDTADPGERICVRAKRREDADTDHTIAFDVEVRANDGRLLQWMEKVELVGHQK